MHSCRGFLFGNIENRCVTNNRDKICDKCRNHKNDGIRTINSNRICIIPFYLIESYNSTCQLLSIKTLQNIDINIKKRYNINISQQLIFENFDSIPKEIMLINYDSEKKI